MLTKKMIRIISIPFFLFSLLGIFPVFFSLTTIIRDRDLLINYNEYQKKYVLIDSIICTDNEGTNSSWVYGFSKELNNYKTKIYFGSIKDDDLSEKIETSKKGYIYKYVWYRYCTTKAYLGEKSQIKYPIKSHLFNILRLPVLWVVSLLICYIFIEIEKKEKKLNLR
ncbi:hypothetical protein [Flavobacterium davisii]|uniref:hypothetical protein n=1 Tax=Flavobacterium davisii TaxID=2906077 RepID=UPI0035CF8B6F